MNKKFLLGPLFLLCSGLYGHQSTFAESVRRNALVRILKERQIPFEEKSLFADYGGFGSSLYIPIPPSQASSPADSNRIGTLILGIPLFSESEETLPFGFETGLAFAEKMRERGSSLAIQVVFLGDESSGLPEDLRRNPHKGLEELYASLEEPEKTLLLYLDLPAPPDSILVHHGAARALSALNVVKPFYDRLRDHNIPLDFAVWFNELYKLGLVEGHPVMRYALYRSINTLYITSESDAEKKTSAGTEELAEALADYADTIGVSADNLDYHFILLRGLGRYFFIPEPAAVTLFIAGMGTFLLGLFIYGIFRRNMLILQWRIFIPHLWIIAVFLISLTITLEIAGGVVSLPGSIFEDTPFARDFGWAVFKIIIAGMLLSLQFSFWNKLIIPKKASFYGNGAVLLVVLGLCGAAFLDITFIPVFLWILLFMIIGAAAPLPIPVYLCASMAPLMSLGPLANLLWIHRGSVFLSAGNLTDIILSKNIVNSLSVAVVTLPFLLLIERGLTLQKNFSEKKSEKKISHRKKPILVFLGCVLAGLGLYSWRLGTLPYQAPERRSIEGSERTLRIDLDYTSFLARRNVHILLEAWGRPLSFNLYLEAADGSPPVIYAASMPFTLIDERKTAAFRLGEGPPNPFSTDLVLPVGFSGLLRVEAVYTQWDPGIDDQPQPKTQDYILMVSRTVKI
ncbi:MAG: hypothetical protein LBG90_00950 [Spirochaetaceae bacterium]|jgi:hypothetical protein|nr:hypothetical protein [Spirochaetaceae bacterium]